jgi:hypothetical protein
MSFFKTPVISPQIAQQFDDDGSPNKLSQADIDAIRAELDKEISETNSTNSAVSDTQKLQMINNAIYNLRNVPGKIRKAIVAAIGAYNVTQRRFDNLDPYLKRGVKSGYPCGTFTCKQRGKKIKKALVELSQVDEHALGNLGVGGVAVATANQVGSTVGNVASFGAKTVGNLASSAFSMYNKTRGQVPQVQPQFQQVQPQVQPQGVVPSGGRQQRSRKLKKRR